jgi:hypothetical protein
MRTFKLERITRADPMTETYAIPSDFDINRYLSGAWGIYHSGEPTEVRLRFFPPAAARVRESTWHPSQNLSDGPKGSVNMTVTVTGTVEITPWILGWGDAVEVIAPPELRKKIAEAGAKMAARNGDLPPPLRGKLAGDLPPPSQGKLAGNLPPSSQGKLAGNLPPPLRGRVGVGGSKRGGKS